MAKRAPLAFAAEDFLTAYITFIDLLFNENFRRADQLNDISKEKEFFYLSAGIRKCLQLIKCILQFRWKGEQFCAFHDAGFGLSEYCSYAFRRGRIISIDIQIYFQQLLLCICKFLPD